MNLNINFRYTWNRIIIFIILWLVFSVIYANIEPHTNTTDILYKSIRRQIGLHHCLEDKNTQNAVKLTNILHILLTSFLFLF
jgi:hypothetical protein